MLHLLVDTCVWIDLAKDPEQRPVLRVLDELVNINEVELLVPRIVLDELARTKSRIVQDSGRSMSSVLKRVKDVVSKVADPEKLLDVLDVLNDADRKIPALGDAVNTAIGQVERLLNAASIVELSDDLKSRAAQRAIDGVAPFHHNKNSIDDAILLEAYADAVRSCTSANHEFGFVTHNTNDFSDPTGNNKLPHPDLAPLFAEPNSRYFITLSESLKSVRTELISEAMLDREELDVQPRSLTEIDAASDELFEKVWYGRHKTLEHKVLSGQTKLVEKEDLPVLNHATRPVQRDVWERATAAAKRVEEKYGLEQLGPWSAFEWGMLNGKLSALRWALGEDWDMLDT